MCEAIPLSGAAFNILGVNYILVRWDYCELFDRHHRRTLRHEPERECRRASVPVGPQRDRHRRADRPQHNFLDDADAHRMLAPAPASTCDTHTHTHTHSMLTFRGTDSRFLCAQANSVLVHASYSSSTMLNDVALLYFATPFTSSNAVSVLPLPAQDTAFAGGLNCTVSGWGMTSSSMRRELVLLRALQL